MREARVSVDDAAYEAMGIEELVSLCRVAGLRSFEELACHGTGAIVRVTVETRIDEDRLAALEYVDRWERVGATGEADTELYVIAFTAPELPESLAGQAAGLVGTCDPDVRERGATLSFVGSQDAISGIIDEYEAAGIAPDLQKLGAYGGRDDPLDELTDRQRQVIRTAFDMGYYEVPRTVSTADVAAELDLDPSTVTEHLQRAERNLLTRLL